MSRTHCRRAACRWEGHRYWPGWPGNVPLTIQEHPAGQAIPAQEAAREKTLADNAAASESECVERMVCTFVRGTLP